LLRFSFLTFVLKNTGRSFVLFVRLVRHSHQPTCSVTEAKPGNDDAGPTCLVDIINWEARPTTATCHSQTIALQFSLASIADPINRASLSLLIKYLFLLFRFKDIHPNTVSPSHNQLYPFALLAMISRNPLAVLAVIPALALLSSSLSIPLPSYSAANVRPSQWNALWGQKVMSVEGETDRNPLETWLDSEEITALDKLLANIAPGANTAGAVPGTVVASPSKEHPNYYYQCMFLYSLPCALSFF
jgi:hypothetical protein